MAKSLQEQLLQSGAAKPKQAKKARREKAESEKAARKSGDKPAATQALEQQVADAQAQKRERDRQLNAEQKARREAHEIEHSIAQIIERNQIAAESGDDSVAYSYTIDNQIRRLQVSDGQRRDLAQGLLAIARHRDVAALVPRRVAERLQEKIPELIWLVSNDASAPDSDDPSADYYADYEVPDDLMW